MRSGGFVIGGGYLLSHFRSTIGVAGFNFSVRNGKRWSPRAIATLVSLHSQCLRDTGRYKVKKSVDILPEGGEIITRFACLVGAEYVTITLAAVVCHSDGGGRGGGFLASIPRLARGSCDPERVRVISIARLRTLPPVHLRPIDVVVYNDPWMEILSWGGLRA